MRRKKAVRKKKSLEEIDNGKLLFKKFQKTQSRVTELQAKLVEAESKEKQAKGALQDYLIELNRVRLTKRQRVILQLRKDGLTNKEVGARLGIAERTVKFHITRVLVKVKSDSLKNYLRGPMSLSKVAMVLLFVLASFVPTHAQMVKILAVPQTTQHSVSLSWKASTSTVSGYNVKRGTAAGGPYQVVTATGNVTNFIDTGVQAGTTYYYVISAIANGVESTNSNEAQAVIPSSPPGPVQITTTSISPCTVGQQCSFTLGATGGTTPYTWTATGLPSNVTLSNSGVASGIPQAAGTTTPTFMVAGGGTTATATLSLTVNPPPPITISTNSLSACTVGSPCNATFSISGGVAPYTLALVGLPDGVTQSGLGYSGSPIASGTNQVSAIASDSDGDTPATKVLSLLVNPAPVPGQTQSLWTSSDAPANQKGNDSGSVELGLKFTPSVSGSVVAIKFWKASNSTGTHTVHLWGSGTTALATVTSTGETASGWQTVTLAAPLAVTAGTQYIVSYHTVQYPWNVSYFSTARSVGNLTAPINAGVYCYSSSACKPGSTYMGSNYWADVMFQPTSTAPPPVSITIVPSSTQVQVGKTQQFTGPVSNTTNTAVVWTATAGCGTITNTGLFTATAVSSPCTGTVTSVADVTKTATAQITVTPPPATLTMTCTVLQAGQISCTGSYTNMPAGTNLNSTFVANGITATQATPLP